MKTLFGVESVKDTQSIDLVIKMEEWDKNREYDRMGLEEEYTEFLGNKVVCHSLPIRPGRNLAVMCGCQPPSEEDGLQRCQRAVQPCTGISYKKKKSGGRIR